MDGIEQLICCSVEGEVRGYKAMPEAKNPFIDIICTWPINPPVVGADTQIQSKLSTHKPTNAKKVMIKLNTEFKRVII